MPVVLKLEVIPGYSDLQDTALGAGAPTYGLHVGHAAVNATFGMVRLETFRGRFVDGDTVPLPVSPIDLYTYERSELNYLWTITNSGDPKTHWISGPDSLWFGNWQVDQTTGLVSSSEWYRRSVDPSVNAKESKDGVIRVITIGQRRRADIVMAVPASYEAIDTTQIATDKPLGQTLIQSLNDDAKFSAVSTEVIYMGEFVDGDTVPQPLSPADGHQYSYAETRFMHCWRWTTAGESYVQPPSSIITGGLNVGLVQLGPMQASVSNTGACAVSVSFIYNGGQSLTTPAGYGRIAVFAFCTRSAIPGTLPLANNFTELALSKFVPGPSLRASTVMTIKKNTDEAILTPEFFGPALYADGDTVPLPVSPVDGYQYSRGECQYVTSWSIISTGAIPPGGGDHDRMPIFYGAVDPGSGHVQMQIWRLPPGGPFTDGDNTHARMSVLIVARRQADYSLVVDGDGINPGDDGGGGGGGGGGDGNAAVLVEIPLGIVDGANRTFSTMQLPNPQGSLQLYSKGLNLRPGVDYSVSGQTITFVTAP